MKKNNKKGFTLVELIAVIAILSILLVMALPQVLELFNDSREGAFITQVQSIYRAAEEQYVSDQLSPNVGSTATRYCRDETNSNTEDDLTVSSDAVYYDIEFNSDGQVTKIIVSDGSKYSYTSTSSPVKIGDIKTIDGELATITCPAE